MPRRPPEGVVEGPPIWKGATRWWRGYRKAAITRARGMGLVTKWLPLAPLSGALITTGLGISLFFFTQPVIYFIIVFGVMIVGYIISFISGYTLDEPRMARACAVALVRALHRRPERDQEGRRARRDRDVGSLPRLRRRPRRGDARRTAAHPYDVPPWLLGT